MLSAQLFGSDALCVSNEFRSGVCSLSVVWLSHSTKTSYLIFFFSFSATTIHHGDFDTDLNGIVKQPAVYAFRAGSVIECVSL